MEDFPMADAHEAASRPTPRPDSEAAEAAGMATDQPRPASRFSFAMPKHPSASRPPLPPSSKSKERPDGDYLTIFDGTVKSSETPAVRIIPKLENTWRPEKRMKNIMVDQEVDAISTADRFESETLTAAAATPEEHQYGLTIVAKKVTQDSADANGIASQPSLIDLELQKLRQDLDALPDEASLDVYENTPVEEFAEALLRGMGWEKGKPIGRNCTTVVDPVEPARRQGREGLGAVPAPKAEKEKKYIKPGETRDKGPNIGKVMCIVTGAHTGLRGQIVKAQGSSFVVALLQGGERVSVKEEELAEIGSSDEEKAVQKLKELTLERADYDRRHRQTEYVNDKKADVQESRKKEDKSTRKQISSGAKHGNRSEVQQQKDRDDHLQERSKREDDDSRHHGRDRSSKANDEERHPSRSDDKDRERDRDKYAHSGKGRDRERRDRHGHRGESRGSLEKESIKPDRRGDLDDSFAGKKGTKEELISSWLVPDIRVRIVSKSARGRLYLKKGRVVDVISPSICDVLMDESGELLQGVKQEHLETALPKRGGRVLVVGGRHKGQVGKLQERDSEKGVGVVQLEENYEVLSFNLDDLAEFVGTFGNMEP